MPLLGELSRSSRDSFESDSDSKESWDDRLNSPKSGISCFCLFLSYSRVAESNKLRVHKLLNPASHCTSCDSEKLDSAVCDAFAV